MWQKYSWFLGTCLALAVTVSAWAQDAPPNIDDLTIKAGYCLGVRQAWLQIDLSCMQAREKILATSSASQALYESKCQSRKADIERLSSFLSAKGYTSASETGMAVDKEVNLGKADFNDCVFHANISDYVACKQKCNSAPQSETCIQTCPKPATCQKTDSCLTLDFLPANQ